MFPPFGFSVGDFINVIGLINTIRKALRDVGGAEHEVRMLLLDLQQLELVLTQLKDGEWGKAGDTCHVNAVRGVALSGNHILSDFLQKVESFRDTLSRQPCSTASKVTRSTKKVQWTISMKEEISQFRLSIISKIVTISLLLDMPLR